MVLEYEANIHIAIVWKCCFWYRFDIQKTNTKSAKLQIVGNKPNGAKTESVMALYGAKTEIWFGTIWWYMYHMHIYK